MEKGKILLVVAHPEEVKVVEEVEEVGEVERNLGFQENSWELFQCGMGKVAGSSLRSFLLSRENLPKLIINFGLAGAIQENLKVGDLILVKEVEKVEKVESFKLSSWFLKKTLNFFKARHYPCHADALLTLEEPLVDSQKRDFLRKSRALAVDMEAYYLAKVAMEFKVPFLSLKVISDFADEEALEMVKKEGPKYLRSISLSIPALLNFLFPAQEGKSDGDQCHYSYL